MADTNDPRPPEAVTGENAPNMAEATPRAGLNPGSADADSAEPETDTDERFEDHPELAPDQSRISVERVERGDAVSIRRLANTGDLSGDPRDAADHGEGPAKPLSFKRNSDFAGDDGSISTDADFSRGSGWIGGEPRGQDAAGTSIENEPTPRELARSEGFPQSENQILNRDAALRETPEGRVSEGSPDVSGAKGATHAGESAGDIRDQGRDLGSRRQVSLRQSFGRDVGASGLPGNANPDEEGGGIFQKGSMGREHADWTAVLGKLGGSSPGSEENLRLAGIFHKVKFPASPEEVLGRLDPRAEFQVKPGVAVDLRDAVQQAKVAVFRNINDIIDCVKDALRRAESLERHAG